MEKPTEEETAAEKARKRASLKIGQRLTRSEAIYHEVLSAEEWDELGLSADARIEYLGEGKGA